MSSPSSLLIINWYNFFSKEYGVGMKLLSIREFIKSLSTETTIFSDNNPGIILLRVYKPQMVKPVCLFWGVFGYFVRRLLEENRLVFITLQYNLYVILTHEIAEKRMK